MNYRNILADLEENLFKYMIFVTIGILIGGYAVTDNLASDDSLPPKDKVSEWAKLEYQESVVNERNYIKSFEEVNFTESEMNDFYLATYNVTVRTRIGDETVLKNVYIRKDGYWMFTPQKIAYSKSFASKNYNSSKS